MTLSFLRLGASHAATPLSPKKEKSMNLRPALLLPTAIALALAACAPNAERGVATVPAATAPAPAPATRPAPAFPTAPAPASAIALALPGPTAAAAPAAGPAAAPALPAPPTALPLLVVHKTPTCGCCGAWVEHMRQAGFTVQVHDADNLEPVKRRLGVPYGKGSCHTAEIDGYLVEGHVPAEDVKRLLAQRPQARGLVLPGMPIGSPGMELPDGRSEPYTVELVARDGATTAFARH